MKVKKIDYSDLMGVKIPFAYSLHDYLIAQKLEHSAEAFYTDCGRYKSSNVLGFELEYEILEEDYLDQILEVFNFAYSQSKVPIWYKNDFSLCGRYSREFNFAPQTLLQCINTFRNINWEVISKLTSDSNYGAMHIHSNITWFNSKDAVMLFAMLASEECLNLDTKVSEVYKRPFNFYTSAEKNFLIQNYSRLFFEKDKNGYFKSYNSLEYDYDYSNMFTYRHHYGSMEWRAFKSPRCLEDVYDALAAFLTFSMFSNKKGEQFVKELKDLKIPFEYLQLRSENTYPVISSEHRETLTAYQEFWVAEFLDFFNSRFDRIKTTLQNLH